MYQVNPVKGVTGQHHNSKLILVFSKAAKQVNEEFRLSIWQLYISMCYAIYDRWCENDIIEL